VKQQPQGCPAGEAWVSGPGAVRVDVGDQPAHEIMDLGFHTFTQQMSDSNPYGTEHGPPAPSLPTARSTPTAHLLTVKSIKQL
jgi:hypothetical protein